MFVRCTSSTRSCSERRLSSRVVATLLAIVPLLLLEPTRRPLLSTSTLNSAPRSPILEVSDRRRVGPRYKGFLLALDTRASLAYGWRAVGNPAI